MEASPAPRPGSIRSVASNSSLSSSVSLARRPRTTRTRSKTVTSNAQPQDIPPSPVPSDLPYLTANFVEEPLEVEGASSQNPLTEPPPRPPKSPQRLEAGAEIRSSDTTSSQAVSVVEGSTYVEPTQSTVASAKPSKAAKQASSLPHLDTGYRPPPSAFSRDPALTPVINVRDSVSTQRSGVSSSLYPPSTSTASGPASPTSPESMAGQVDPPPFALEVNEAQDYDSDDVSYRLRLLVKNNYFLPPAHSKPSPSDFATSPLAPQKKSSAPAFLDIFRVGKSKSKPTTPTTETNPAFDSMAPMLRTTSDSISAGYAIRSAPPRSLSQAPHASPHISAPPSRGRVVVVREKMLDIATAAKQAEQDLKARGMRAEQGSQNGNPVDDGYIDPTDAVDIPLPSPSYPFAVQASAMHGLGVLESVGADILADVLPPSQNPNLSSSYDSAEDMWRKALLSQAVGHSLSNTPEASTFSHILGASTPLLASPRSNGPGIPVEDVGHTTQKLIQQRIITYPVTDDPVDPSSVAKHIRQKSVHSQASTSRISMKRKLGIPDLDILDSSRPSSHHPQRVETPSGPLTPLGPPPRRYMNSSFSISQTDLSAKPSLMNLSAVSKDNESRHTLRRTVSSPSLVEDYESAVSRRSLTTPPPVPRLQRDSQTTFASFNTIHRNDNSETPSEPRHSETEEPRHSLALSAMRSRPSLSEYSQASQSPTTSVFQEMLNRNPPSNSSATPDPSRFSEEGRSSSMGHPSSRSLAMSPPPRISSSLAHNTLPPPPRSSSLNYQTPYLPSLSRPFPYSDHGTQIESTQPSFEILAPEPSTPPLPQNDLFPEDTTITIPSAPGPSSSTSFFDSIQTQPNAMDDLESSDEDEDDEPAPIHPHPKSFGDSRARAASNAAATNPTIPKPSTSIMRHGNFSTPYIRTGESYRQNPGIIDIKSKQAISNTPIRTTKNDLAASSDFFRYAQDNPPNVSSSFGAESNRSELRRPSTADHVTLWRNNQKAQESLRKLDGMLLQHMEDEKDTIKRIASSLKQTAAVQSSSPLGR